MELFDSRINRFCSIVLAGALALGGYNWICWSSLTASDWATWFGSIGTVTAVIVAAFAIYAQNKNAITIERLRRDEDEAVTLLALCYLGREIRQMCTLTGFQIDQPGNPILYADISADFASMASMVGALPIARVASRSAVGISLHLRRIALQMSDLYKVAPQPGDGFFLWNRDRIFDLQSQCSEANSNLTKMLDDFDAKLYMKHKVELHRL